MTDETGGTSLKRERIDRVILPDYTRGEELFNAVTHVLGLIIGGTVLTLAMLASKRRGGAWDMLGAIVYGISMLAVYAVSSIYHGLKKGRAKKAMRIVDHCTIYLLIAGTYTPVLLSAIRPQNPAMAWIVLACEWAVAAFAAAMTARDLQGSSKKSMLCYIAMGWLIVLVLRPAVQALTPRGFIWLLTGGIVYTIGAALYGLGKKKRYIHGIFHIFVDVASVLQAVCILRYAI